jgi:deoxyribodipyrimidine photo-lyase
VVAALERFAGGALKGYAAGRDRPAEPGTSRLSPHLHFGEVGPRQAWAAAEGRPGAEAWQRQLVWREFAHHLLAHFPSTPDEPLRAAFSRFPWSGDARALEAWKRGRTGYPLVDAGMRELWATGWMHNRVRMVAASFLTKHLLAPWQEGERWFWDTLVDADLPNNTLGWQWTAGCGADAAPFFRIFNPVLQNERFDPERAYLRRWLPELRGLPDAWIHRPWEAPASVLAAAGVQLGRDYPQPVIDFRASREAALAAYGAIKGPTLTAPRSRG